MEKKLKKTPGASKLTPNKELRKQGRKVARALKQEKKKAAAAALAKENKGQVFI